MTDPQNLLIGLSIAAGLILLLICPSRAGMWRAVSRLIVQAAAWMDLECQARADGCDACEAAYRARKAANTDVRLEAQG